MDVGRATAGQLLYKRFSGVSVLLLYKVPGYMGLLSRDRQLRRTR